MKQFLNALPPMTWFRNDSCIILKQYMIRSAFSPILSLFVLLAFTTCTRNIVREYTPGEVLTLHESVLTIDSHTDTPLRIMRPGTDLGSRGDSRKRDGKVDFIRMKEGGLDGIFFAVFVGQSARNPQGNEKARVLAMRLFDSIHAVVDRYPDLVELALEEHDHATNIFLQWFVSEQVEEEDSANDVVQKIKLMGDAPGGLFMLDRELGQRVFTSPADGG